LVHSHAEGADWSAREAALAEFETVYRENVRYVWRCVRHLGVRESEVEDLTHEVFLVIGRKLATFEQRSTLRTWIYGITIRVCSDYRKRASVRREIPVAEHAERAHSSDPHEEATRGLVRSELQCHLEALVDAQREVFVLYEIEELPMREVAETLSIPLQTAYSRLHAARQALKARLGAWVAP